MSNLRGHNPVRRGVTLIELLVVVGIMLILATITIPAIRMLTEGRRIREPARAINVYFGKARSRAIESGRPYGVMFERFEQGRHASMLLRHVEVPPPYGGDQLGTVVRVMDYTYVDPSADTGWVNFPYYWPNGPRVLKLMVRDGDLSPRLISHGDIIQLNGQGPWYTIRYDALSQWPTSFPVPFLRDFPPDADGFINFNPPGKMVVTDPKGNTWITSHLLTLVLDPAPGNRCPFPEARGVPAGAWITPLAGFTDPLPRVAFQILRQPVPSAAAPLELGRGVVVDLAASGTDTNPYWFAALTAQEPYPVTVLFAPDGAIDRVVVHGVPSRVTEPIHLLVGKWERIGMPTPDLRPASIPAGWTPEMEAWPNWLDTNNLWVAVSPQTGLVTVADNVHMDPPPHGWPDPDNNNIPFLWDDPSTWRGRILRARTFARQAQISKGGR